MTVYEQLKQWQSIPHARREWTDYRKKLTDFVIRHTEGGTSAALLGAGHCDDLDLTRLSGHFRRIILVDRDFQAMDGAEKGYRLSEGCTLEKQVHDFLGITEKEYESFSDCLQRGIALRGANTDIRDLAELAQRKLEELYGKLEGRPPTLVNADSGTMDTKSGGTMETAYGISQASGACDYLVAAGLHSQLDNMFSWIWNAYEQALGQHAPWMYPYLAKKSDQSVKRFDEALLQSAGRGLILAFEGGRLGIPGKVQGAARGMLDMDEAVRGGRLERTASETLYWNFDLAQGIAYEMVVGSYQGNHAEKQEENEDYGAAR